MKMQEVNVEFVKRLYAKLYVPVDMQQQDVEKLADDVARRGGVAGWDDPGWSVVVYPLQQADLPDEDCQLETRPARYGGGTWTTLPQGSLLNGDEVLVASDERDDMVHPLDAHWWRVAAAEDEESEP